MHLYELVHSTLYIVYTVYEDQRFVPMLKVFRVATPPIGGSLWACTSIWSSKNFIRTASARSVSKGKLGSTGKGVSVVRNENIKFKSMRVVYQDVKTNENTWKMMERQEAITLAKTLGLDLVLINGDSDPPVCKILDYGKLVMDKNKKDKKEKAIKKSKGMKEMFVKGGIDQNDLNTKIKKVREFLLVGHTVKIVVLAKKDILRRNPHAIDETTLKIVEMVEDYVKTVKQGRAGSAFRTEFTLNPKTGAEIEKLQRLHRGEGGEDETSE